MTQHAAIFIKYPEKYINDYINETCTIRLSGFANRAHNDESQTYSNTKATSKIVAFVLKIKPISTSRSYKE